MLKVVKSAGEFIGVDFLRGWNFLLASAWQRQVCAKFFRVASISQFFCCEDVKTNVSDGRLVTPRRRKQRLLRGVEVGRDDKSKNQFKESVVVVFVPAYCG